MIMARRNTLDMTQGPIFRKLLLYAYPLILGSVLNTLYNVADKIIAGRFLGDNAMAAVGICGSPIALIFNTMIGIASGVGVLCGNFIGARKEKSCGSVCRPFPLPAL
jgi:Na+-driven multidrug efflux pump